MIEEMRDSVEFLEAQLNLGSRLDLVSEHIDEIIDTIKTMMHESTMGEEDRVSLQSLYVRANRVAEKVKEMVKERESSNLKPSSRTWE